MARQLWFLRHGEAEPHDARPDEQRRLTARGEEQAIEIVYAAGADKRVLLVGHNPDFEQVLHDLTGARIDLKKGAVAGVRLERRRGTLIALLRPREIARIG